MQDDRWLITIPEAARLLGVGRTKAFQMAKSGELPGVIRLGRSVRVSKPVLLRWLGAEPEHDGLPHERPAAGLRPDQI